ncbi:heterokaryon incompatibility protein-domain-containing protein [Alternaria rosae]|uniref:heterokaryon incompatibility protein-domain-containing protein n=1 Tax=Alternaria rosae TaxID=1187941 RepID=UPI001E8EC1D8|nr:heterokaryon incompatibility protein-domain-containing protein [Alternaria rosae]KAH6876276.1 heterokaryon incompatibility protein-domain-containing protein [Alternaria rosae]
MDVNTSENDTRVQRSQPSTAPDKRPVDDPPHSDISESADLDNNDENTDECAPEAAEMQTLCYDPLQGPDIRLITIDPAMQDGKLKLTMEQVPLTDALDFHVLSYVWGDSTYKKTIVVNGQRLDVTENLHDFLETTRKYETNFLSHHEHLDYKTLYNTGNAQTVAGSSIGKVTGPATMPARFWIDAICINQNDLNERNEQVPRMGDIYSMASRVWIWMGLPSKILSEDFDLEVLKRGLDYGVQDSFKHPPSDELRGYYHGEVTAGKLRVTRRAPDTPLIEQFAAHQRQVVIERTIVRLRAMGFVLEPGPMMDMMFQQYTQIYGHFSSEDAHAPFNRFTRQLASLLSQPYLTRVWIIQEYVLNPRTPIALLGSFVLDLQHLIGTVMRLLRETHLMNEHSKALVFATVGQAATLITLHEVRMEWHGSSYVGNAEGGLTRLSPGERLNHLLQQLSNRRCTNPVDRFYGILGFLNHHELPRSLLPDYSLPVEQVAQAYTRYIIESTGDLEIIECTMSHESTDCPSWTAHATSFTGQLSTHITVSKGRNPHSFSEDGRCLTLEGTFLGEIVKCSCTDRPGETMGEHLKYLDEELFETASQITGKPKSEIFKFWLNEQVDAQGDLLPSNFKNFDSMQELLRRYHDICEDIPQEALDGLNRSSITQKHIIFQTPCRDPKLLYAILRLADPRFCLLSTGQIMVCFLKHTETNVMSRTHGENDCAWALKGLCMPAILRPKGDAYEYCGPLVSVCSLMKDRMVKREKDHLFLDDEFFATRKVQQVTLV